MNNYKSKRVFVTGAGGFLGSHLCERLVELGANVTAFCHYNALGRAGWLDYSPLRDQMNIVFGDITDPGTIRPPNGVGDIVFHLAALIGIPYSYQATKSYIATNVQGTYNVLEAANNDGAERVVVTSTSECYGTMQYKMDEAHPIYPQSPYAASKVGGDAMALAYHLSFGLPIIILRPFNTYGDRQSLRAVIPQIICQLLDCKANDTNRLLLGNAEAERDFTYVTDTVEGFIKAGIDSQVTAVGQAINLGSGACVSIAEVSNLAASIIGVDNVEIAREFGRLRPGDSEVDRLLSDNSKARVCLDWKPEVCLLEGLTKTIEGFAQNKGLYGGGYAI